MMGETGTLKRPQQKKRYRERLKIQDRKGLTDGASKNPGEVRASLGDLASNPEKKVNAPGRW